MTQIDFSPDVRLEQAVAWIMAPKDRTGNTTVIELSQRFGFSNFEACEAINAAHSHQALKEKRSNVDG